MCTQAKGNRRPDVTYIGSGSTKPRSSNPASMRMACSLLLQAFDDNELRAGGFMAHLLEGSVFRRVVPFVEPLHALEFDDYQALGVPVPLEHLDLASAR